jgi:hypothetical protein
MGISGQWTGTGGFKPLITAGMPSFAVDAHKRAMISAASYLPGEGEGARNSSHYVPELSCRARGFATWAMLRYLGRNDGGDIDRLAEAILSAWRAIRAAG